MSNTIELALMAGASYVSSRPEEFNRLPIPEGWSKISLPDSYMRDPARLGRMSAALSAE